MRIQLDPFCFESKVKTALEIFTEDRRSLVKTTPARIISLHLIRLICYTPNGPPACFLTACAGAAYAFPNDNNALGGGLSSLVLCCIRALCPAPSRQPGLAAASACTVPYHSLVRGMSYLLKKIFIGKVI